MVEDAVRLIVHNVMNRWPLDDESVHVLMFSPSYWRERDYKHKDQIGQEDRHDCLKWAMNVQPERDCCYICNTRIYMKEGWRVLHRTGTAYMVVDDSYSHKTGDGLKAKDRVGIPSRIALALQADGWYWRTMIPWWKTNAISERVADRPVDSHEYIVMLTKRQRYYADKYGNMLPSRSARHIDDLRYGVESAWENYDDIPPGGVARRTIDWQRDALKLAFDYHSDQARQAVNLLSSDASHLADMDGGIVSCQSPTGANNEDHYAGYHPAMVAPLVRAATSRHGVCPECGFQWRRQTKKSVTPYTDRNTKQEYTADGSGKHGNESSTLSKVTYVETIGWTPTCSCQKSDVVRPVVLDPFVGTGTTGTVAVELGCDFIGFDCNPDNIAISRERITGERTVTAVTEDFSFGLFAALE